MDRVCRETGWTETMSEKQLPLERDLRSAVARGELYLLYQPEIDLRSGRIACFETLLRWDHPELGSVPPDQFIPLAEEIGLIRTNGQHVLERACNDAVLWPDGIRVAVNVSASQFSDGDLPDIVASVLRESGLHPSRLELEVTRSMLMESDPTTHRCVHALRGTGVRMAIGDFGTGHSALGYLVKFPFDKVKIDRSFVSGTGEVRSRDAVVHAIIGLCAALGITCTTEGVETHEQLAMLTRENCPQVQGCLFSRPLPAQDIPGLLEG
jgi:EAL domain-containing protein (putative c-di-GMP-specific phosphodiesterase class I)